MFPILPPSSSFPPHKLEGQKVGWYLRIMVAEGEGGRQLASSAPICFSERGKENAEDVMPEWLTLQQKGRLKVKLVNILLISNHHTLFASPTTPPSQAISLWLSILREGGRSPKQSWDFAEIYVLSRTAKRLSTPGSPCFISLSSVGAWAAGADRQPQASARSFCSLY